MLEQNDGRAISAISNPTVAAGNSDLCNGCRPATRIDLGPIAGSQTGLFLEHQRLSSRRLLEKMLKKWIERANDRDQVIAEWLNWLCDNGSVFGRC